MAEAEVGKPMAVEDIGMGGGNEVMLAVGDVMSSAGVVEVMFGRC